MQESGTFPIQKFLVPVHQFPARFRHDEAGFFPLNLVHQGKQGEAQTQAIQKERGLVGSLDGRRGDGRRRFIASVRKTGSRLHAVPEQKMEAVPFPEFKNGAVGQLCGS